MRRNVMLVFAVIMALTMAFSPLALAQQATPTTTPVSADAPEATPTTEMGTSEAATGTDMADTSGMADKAPAASGTVRQSFDLLGADGDLIAAT